MVTQILPRDLAARLTAGEEILLLDVRQADEHAIAKLLGSTLIPLGELPGRVGEVDPPPGVLVVVYCHHGNRSLSGAAILARAGVGPVASLAGGIDAWSRLIDPTVPRY